MQVANLDDQEVLELFNQTIIPADESTVNERTTTPTQVDLVLNKRVMLEKRILLWTEFLAFLKSDPNLFKEQDIQFFQENGLNPLVTQVEQLRTALEQHVDKKIKARQSKLEQYLRSHEAFMNGEQFNRWIENNRIFYESGTN